MKLKKDTKTARTAAERKAAERLRRQKLGQVCVQEWVHESVVAKLRAYAAKLRAQ